MRSVFRFIPVGAYLLLLLTLQAITQDSPSLGDAARQARLQKQQKEASAKDAPNKAGQEADSKDTPKRVRKIITNEELPAHSVPAARPVLASEASRGGVEGQPPSAATEGKGQVLRSQIVAMKNNVTSIEAQIESLNSSIHFAPANCASNCAQWNERQLQKQQQVEQMKAQLEDKQKQLEDLQESARQQGFGSSVYDP
jgi:hypothetical protein